MSDTVTVENITLGKKLRQLTEQARVNTEATKLIEVLEEAANRGEDHVKFNDLREVVPNMIMSETLWNWLRVNELKFEGYVDQNTAAYVYVISW